MAKPVELTTRAIKYLEKVREHSIKKFLRNIKKNWTTVWKITKAIPIMSWIGKM